MKVIAIQTALVKPKDDLKKVLSDLLSNLVEQDVVVITSKIVSLCEGWVVDKSKIEDRFELIKKEADYYTLPTVSKYGISLTIKHNQLSMNAGIDESNSDGLYTLLPKDPQASANKIRDFLSSLYKLKNLGVIIIDSMPFALKWGHTGRALAHSGFWAVNSHVGELDLFGRRMQMTNMNIVDGLASAAHVEMGEVAERTPVAVISGASKVVFQKRNPSQSELDFLKIERVDDAFAPLLDNNLWHRGGGGYF